MMEMSRKSRPKPNRMFFFWVLSLAFLLHLNFYGNAHAHARGLSRAREPAENFKVEH